MRHSLLPLILGSALILGGCSSKKYFEPQERYSADAALAHYEGEIVDISRDGATLSDGRYIDKNGISKINLGKGFRFLSENSRYVLAGDDLGTLKVIDKKSGKLYKKITFEMPIVSASIHRDLIAYVLNNNAFGVYSMTQGKKLVENRSERTFAIDARAATPLFIDTLVVMPMLDGKLVIFDVQEPDLYKVVYLSSDRIFNNIVYLSRTDDTLVAATPKKLLTLGAEGQYDYRANIAEVAIDTPYIYLFTKEGEIIKLDIYLKVLARKKFKFAQYSAATVVNGKIYALDKQGSLIVLDKALNRSKIYDVGEVTSAVYISGTKLYKDGIVIHLDKLGYE